MLGNIRKTTCVLLLLCTVLLCGCGPSLRFLRDKERGFYPETGDFPDTQWVCREINVCLYMLSHEERYMIGTYIVDDISYRIVATFWFGSFDFWIYSSTNISISEYSDSMVHCEEVSCGYIYTDYRYRADTGTIVCSVRNSQSVNGEVIPKILTFEKVGEIAKETDVRWYANEIDMYLESFKDIDGYFEGEIAIDGEKYYIHALEIGNNSYFRLCIENGRLNNSRLGTVSQLINMHLEITDNQIVAKVSDEYLLDPLHFPDWPYNDVIITFRPLSS